MIMMNHTNNRRAGTSLGTACLCLFLGTGAHGDDTEIYVNQVTGAGAPNVLFIMDTSGSMGSTITVEEPYDPATTYSGDCRTDRVYWSNDGSPPADCTDSGFFDRETDNWVPVEANRCDVSLSPLATVGYATGNYQQWREGGWFFSSERWRDLNDDHNAADNYIECAADAGIHGYDAGAYYADRGASGSDDPWTSDSANAVNDWQAATLFHGNYMNWHHYHGAGTITKTRLEVLQEVAGDLVDSTSGINIGLMRFDTGAQGGYIALAMDDIATNRSAFKSTLNSWWPQGGTPLSETLYEAVQYYTGGDVVYGRSSSPAQSHSSSFTGSLSSGTADYISPMADVCQKHNIIYLTDGVPTSDSHANTAIENMIGKSCVANQGTGGDQNGKCLDDLAKYIYETDLDGGLDEDQTITSYFIGFGYSDLSADEQDMMDATAKLAATGGWYTADSYQELQDAFNNILVQILGRSGMFTAPAVAVNLFNRLEHLDEVYYAMFQPEETTRWFGNVKRYRFDTAQARLVDADDNPAVNEATGNFAQSARSFWTPLSDIDGDNVVKGGVAVNMPASRNLYTWTGTSAPSDDSLATAAHELHEDNSAITKTLLGDAAMTDETRTELLQWARGVDIFDVDDDSNLAEIRPRLGDPLHTRPIMITYGGTQVSPDMTLFAMTNEGLLHAFDRDTGEEVFAFMPQELLPNIADLHANSQVGKAVYGLDGPLVAWVNNTGGTDISAAEGDHAYLYFGMRRGGKNYYAMDVTDRSAPRLKWIIEGGGAGGDFSELGQSWSAPVVTKVRINSTTHDALVFAGGYDPSNDSDPDRNGDAQGRAIYIVDADTGALLWSGGTDDAASPENGDFTATFADMDYSIPSEIRVLDINGDGLADQMYVGDMGGQLWRFDFNNGQSAANLVQGAVIADFGGDGVNNRRFYYPPAAALANDNGLYYLAVALGSGWRAHPLDEVVQDRFYMLRQTPISGPPAGYAKLSHSDLYDATANDVGQLTGSAQTAAISALYAADGWYIDFAAGEKALAEPLIANNQLIFTTYTPTAQAGACGGGAVGASQAYLMSLFDATPKEDLDTSTAGLTAEDRASDLKRGGIAPHAVVLFPPGGGDPVVYVGTEQPFQVNFGNLTQRTYWREVTN